MEGKLARPRAVMYGALAIAFLIGIPWIGAWTLIPLAASVLGYAVLRPRIAGSERPEYVVAATVVNAQVLIGIGIALSGGPHSPAIAMLLLPIVTLPARFSPRGVYAGLGVTVAVLLLSTVAVDPARLRRRPDVRDDRPRALRRSGRVLRDADARRDGAALGRGPGSAHRPAQPQGARRRASRRSPQQAALTGAPICLLAGDLDHFKHVNDEHGHARGDAVLKDTAYVLRKSLRSFELVYRLGGEEFLIVLPGVAPTRAARSPSASAPASRRRARRPAASPISLGVAGAAAATSRSSRCSAPPTPRSTRPSARAATASSPRATTLRSSPRKPPDRSG